MISYPVLESAFVALYLRGLRRPFDSARRRWQAVEQAIRRDCPDEQSLPSCLRTAGLYEEAYVIEAADLALARRLVKDGVCLTPLAEGYPARMLSMLAEKAPPAMWVGGLIHGSPHWAIVGSRTPSEEGAEFARAVARRLAEFRWIVVSGGAPGCDRIAVEAALEARGQVLEFLPCGFGQGFGAGPSQLAMDASEGFSVGRAMERNLFVFASSQGCVVIQPRLMAGGTWSGAVEALRNRICPVYVWAGEPSPAVEALVALGAVPILSPDDLPLGRE